MEYYTAEDFKGEKSITERESDGEIVIEFANGKSLLLSEYLEKRSEILNDVQRKRYKSLPQESSNPFARYEFKGITEDNSNKRDALGMKTKEQKPIDDAILKWVAARKAAFRLECSGMTENKSKPNIPPLSPFPNSPSSSIEASRNFQSSSHIADFLRKMEYGIRVDFEGVKSVTERGDKIVVEFVDGNIIALSRFFEKTRPFLNGFRQHKKNMYKEMECEHSCVRPPLKRKNARKIKSDAVKMVGWRQEGALIIFEYDNGKIEEHSILSYNGPLTKSRIPPLAKFEIKKEAYRKKTPDNTWKPPRTRDGDALIQEKHAHDPWKVVIICMLLNRTTGDQVKGAIPKFFYLCPDAETCTQVPVEEITTVITSLGLQNTRARNLKRFSFEYLKDTWTRITELHGVDRYAADAYAIFCTGRWKDVIPMDNKLIPYWTFLHTIHK